MLEEIMLPQGGNYSTARRDLKIYPDDINKSHELPDEEYDINYMVRCYQDSFNYLDKAYDAADKYGVGMYVAMF